MRRIKPLAERFESKYIPEPMSGCWLWTAAVDACGYGQLAMGGTSHFALRAHRVAWTIYRGEIPIGLQVLHKCDNPPCVNPDHLFLGTHIDNMLDRDSKGRSYLVKTPIDNRGSRHGNSKLTEDDVRAMRQLTDSTMTISQAARQFHIARHTAWEIIKRRRWKHVT